jgi:arginyl-tRNA synthetase
MNLKTAIFETVKSCFDINAEEVIPNLDIQFTPDISMGEYAVPIGFVLAKILHMAPDRIAQEVADHLRGPFEAQPSKGFVNIAMNDEWWADRLQDSFIGYPKVNGRALIEFVSANPTGPVHIGHGRGAVVGSVLTNFLSRVYDVADSEFYINDAGEQIRKFCKSVEIRIRQLKGESVELPEDAYHGEYVVDIARWVLHTYDWDKLTESEKWDVLWNGAVGMMENWHKSTLEKLGVQMKTWTSERRIREEKLPERVLQLLGEASLTYEQEGAVWFKSTNFGDDKDRVLVKSNGEYTYYLVDIAYHLDKIQRGYDLLIDVWGADHIGHVPRMNGALKALGYPDYLKIVLVQTVRFWRQGVAVAMSKRKGEFLTLDELIDEIGKDAARIMFISRSVDATLDFDIEVAKEKAMDNPVYYIQYAYVRARNILTRTAERQYGNKVGFDAHERSLLRLMNAYIDRMEATLRRLDPFVLEAYAWDLADAFHKFYQFDRVVGSEYENCRWLLTQRFAQIMEELFSILGIEKLERM